MATSYYKNKRFTYWRARFTPEPFDAATMQQLLHSAFDKTFVKDRLYISPITDSYCSFIAFRTNRKGHFCANLFSYEKDRISQVIPERFDQENIESEAFPIPKSNDGTHRQILDGMLYFTCFKNHLIVAQDQHLKGRQLEEYFDAMIRQRYPEFPEQQSFILERSISEKNKKAITGINKVNLSGKLHYEPKIVESKSGKKETLFCAFGKELDALMALVKNKLDLTPLTTKGIIEPKDINVSLSLSWKKSKSDEKILDQLDTFANSFRHVEEELDVELQTNSGKFKMGDSRLSKPCSIRHQNDIPDSNDIFDKMIAWYETLVNSDEI